jgi:hypothetical protein
MPVLYSVILWVCVFIVVGVTQQFRASLGNPGKYLAFGIVLVGILLQLGLVTYYDRKRRRELAEALRARGFVLNSDDGQPARSLHYTPEKRHHSYKVLYSGLGALGDRPAHIAEYRYVIGHGRGAQHYRMTEFAVDFSRPAPRFTLSRRRGWFGGAMNLETATEDINMEWRASAGNPLAATEFLSDPRLAEILTLPHKHQHQWAVGDGWVSLTLRQGIRPADLDPAFGTAVRFAELCGG